MLKTISIDLKKLSDVVSKEVVKNVKFNRLNAKVNSLKHQIRDATTLIYVNQYNTDKQNLEKKMEILRKKIPDVSGLVTTTVNKNYTKIGKVDNKILDTSGLVTTAVLNTKIKEVEDKIPNVSVLVQRAN